MNWNCRIPGCTRPRLEVLFDDLEYLGPLCRGHSDHLAGVLARKQRDARIRGIEATPEELLRLEVERLLSGSSVVEARYEDLLQAVTDENGEFVSAASLVMDPPRCAQCQSPLVVDIAESGHRRDICPVCPTQGS